MSLFLSKGLRKMMTVTAVLACVAFTQAQPAFRTSRLSAIAQRIPLNLPAQPGARVEDDSTYRFKDRLLRIRTNALGDISHIGYRLFPKGLASRDILPLLDFVERYCLELDLPSEFSVAERMSLDHVVVTRGDLSLLRRVTPDIDFAIDEIQRRMFRIRWKVGEDSLSVTVPMDYQLLAGVNSIELEDIFERDVKRYAPFPVGTPGYDIERGDTLVQGEYAVTCVGEYLSKDIRSDIYLQKNVGDGYTLMRDSRQPLKSLTNLLLTGASPAEVALRLTLNRYGGRRTSLTVTLQQLLGYFRDEGCQLYVGVKEFDRSHLKASLFALQPKLAYNHLVSVELPVGLLDDASAESIKGVAYTYIPLQNVTEQFFIQDFKE